jgi:hypothetical protein
MAKKQTTCAEFQRDWVLKFYHELGAGKAAALDAHLAECSACQQEQEKWAKMLEGIPPGTVDGDWLRQNRRDVFYRLRGESGRAVLPEKRRIALPAWTYQAAFALLLFVFGLLLGRRELLPTDNLLTADHSAAKEIYTNSPLLLGIKKITTLADGAVEIRYQTINDMSLRGRASDPKVQHILRYAMQNQEPSVRLHAVKAAQLPAGTPEHVEQTTVDALETILDQEANVGIRLAVIKTFASFSSTPRIQQVLFKTMLHDSSEAVRIQAFKSLTEHDVVDELRPYLSTAQDDSNVYIRTKSLELLTEKEKL